MAAPETTVDDAFNNVAAASAARTALQTDANTFFASLATAQGAGLFSAEVLAQMQSEFVDMVERLAANCPRA